MMANVSISLLLLTLIVDIHSHICPQSQTVDTYRLCNIFANTNINNTPAFQSRNFSDYNYCNWGMFWTEPIISCDNSTSEIIKRVIITNIHGTLDFTYPWPDSLIEIDLETYSPYDNTIVGEFDWGTIQSLTYIEEIDLEDNLFSGKLTNDIWNIITSLPSLEYLVLRGNKFEMDFSEININPSSTILELDLSNNYNFYGTMNVASFFNSFPELRILALEWHNIYGYFYNLDVLSNIRTIKLDHNHFSGQLLFSDQLGFDPNLQRFQIDYNEFDGAINWSIFVNLYKLISLDINNNYFRGTIEWHIIADLVNNGKLNYIDLNNNNFNGYVDFSWINKTINLYLDKHIHCDPTIYPCTGGIPTDRTSLWCNSKQSCESTCQCIPTPQPTISPTEYTSFPTEYTSLTPLTTYQAVVNENAPNANSDISLSTLLICLSLVMCCSCFCVIIGVIIGCYSLMKQQNSDKNNNNNIGIVPQLPNIVMAKTISYEENDINVTTGIEIDENDINVTTGIGLPKLPNEEFSNDINYNENINEPEPIQVCVDEKFKQIMDLINSNKSLIKVMETNNEIDNGEISPFSPIDNSYTDNKEGNSKIPLKNFKSESNSEALYVMHSPKSTKGNSKFGPLSDNVSLMSVVEVIDEDNENI